MRKQRLDPTFSTLVNTSILLWVSFLTLSDQNNVVFAHAFPLMTPSALKTTTTATSTTCGTSLVSLHAIMSRRRRPSRASGGGARGQDEFRSKRQERVGQLVRTELSRILHTGNIKGDVTGHLEADLRQRISVVSADVSPDLRQARIAVSIRTPMTRQTQQTLFGLQEEEEEVDNDVDEGQSDKEPIDPAGASSSLSNDNEVDLDSDALYNDQEDENDDMSSMDMDPTASAVSSSFAVDKRRAYSWLVKNTKPIRHTLAQRMSHLKTCPNLSFTQVDVAAAVDVMYLIDQISAKGAKRQSIDWLDGAPVEPKRTKTKSSESGDDDFDEDDDDDDFLFMGDDDDDDDWVDEDKAYFS